MSETDKITHDHCMVAKGIKTFTCFCCLKSGQTNYMNGIQMCEECRKRAGICAICGQPIARSENRERSN